LSKYIQKEDDSKFTKLKKCFKNEDSVSNMIMKINTEKNLKKKNAVNQKIDNENVKSNLFMMGSKIIDIPKNPPFHIDNYIIKHRNKSLNDKLSEDNQLKKNFISNNKNLVDNNFIDCFDQKNGDIIEYKNIKLIREKRKFEKIKDSSKNKNLNKYTYHKNNIQKNSKDFNNCKLLNSNENKNKWKINTQENLSISYIGNGITNKIRSFDSINKEKEINNFEYINTKHDFYKTNNLLHIKNKASKSNFNEISKNNFHKNSIAKTVSCPFFNKDRLNIIYKSNVLKTKYKTKPNKIIMKNIKTTNCINVENIIEGKEKTRNSVGKNIDSNIIMKCTTNLTPKIIKNKLIDIISKENISIKLINVNSFNFSNLLIYFSDLKILI